MIEVSRAKMLLDLGWRSKLETLVVLHQGGAEGDFEKVKIS